MYGSASDYAAGAPASAWALTFFRMSRKYSEHAGSAKKHATAECTEVIADPAYRPSIHVYTRLNLLARAGENKLNTRCAWKSGSAATFSGTLWLNKQNCDFTGF